MIRKNQQVYNLYGFEEIDLMIVVLLSILIFVLWLESEFHYLITSIMNVHMSISD
jgi:hypothetical protein